MPLISFRLPILIGALAAALIAGTAAPAAAQDQLFSFTGAGETIEAGVWLPAADAPAGPRPLVVISHGNGGWLRGHADTAEALAAAGFVVAALTHPGDNYQDQSRSLLLTGRAPQLSALIDHMTGDWRAPDGRAVIIDADRIGALGYSAGGFTVTTIAGGESDPQAILDDCAVHPEFFACRLLAMAGGLDLVRWRPAGRDPRVKAAVIAAPALGMSFTDASLASVAIPIQLWQAADDEILPAPFNVEPIRDRLGRAPEYHRVADARHYDFLSPCNPWMAAELPHLCNTAPTFDRAAFKAAFNIEVVRFFRATLGN